MTIFKKIDNDEIYLYVNGQLVYRRSMITGEEEVLDNATYEQYTKTRLVDFTLEQPRDLLIIKARLTLKPTEESGRKTAILSGYRPNHIFEYKTAAPQLQTTWIGDIIFEGPIEPGETKDVTVRFIMQQPIEKYLTKGRQWWIHEGARLVAEAIIL